MSQDLSSHLCGHAGAGLARAAACLPLSELCGCDPFKGHKRRRSWFSPLSATAPASATRRYGFRAYSITVGPAKNQCLPRGFTSAWCCACGVAQVSINLDTRKANYFQTRIDGWEIYPREVVSLFTVRKELQSKQSNLKCAIDPVLYLKSQENPVAMTG